MDQDIAQHAVPTAIAANPASGPLALTFDPAAFAHFVVDFDLTEDQRTELLQTLWVIMVGFVDLGFHIHPVQQACAAAGETALAPDSGAVLLSRISSKFNRKNSGARLSKRVGMSEDS
jgi:hypothetical protein